MPKWHDHEAPLRERADVITEQQPDEFWIRGNDNLHTTVDELLDSMENNSHGYIKVCAVGPVAVSTAVKVLASARERLAEDGYRMFAQPYFSSYLNEDGERRNRMVLQMTWEPE